MSDLSPLLDEQIAAWVACVTRSDCHPRRWPSALFAMDARRFRGRSPAHRRAIGVRMNRMRTDV